MSNKYYGEGTITKILGCILWPKILVNTIETFKNTTLYLEEKNSLIGYFKTRPIPRNSVSTTSSMSNFDWQSVAKHRIGKCKYSIRTEIRVYLTSLCLSLIEVYGIELKYIKIFNE
jgi:hypothetical protein